MELTEWVAYFQIEKEGPQQTTKTYEVLRATFSKRIVKGKK